MLAICITVALVAFIAAFIGAYCGGYIIAEQVKVEFAKGALELMKVVEGKEAFKAPEGFRTGVTKSITEL